MVFPDVAGISLTKRRGSNTIVLDDGWKLFYSGVEPAQFAQAGVWMLVSPQLASCADEWIPLRGKVSMFKLLDRSLCSMQAYDPNPGALYLGFVGGTIDTLLRFEANDSTIFLVDFNLHSFSWLVPFSVRRSSLIR